MSRNEPQTCVPQETAPAPGSARTAGPKAPVPAPPRADAALTAVRGLTDHSDELAQIGTIPLEERAGALAAIHEELVSVLHEAEG